MKSVKDVVPPTSPSISNSITIGCVFGNLYTFFLKSHYHHEPLSLLSHLEFLNYGEVAGANEKSASSVAQSHPFFRAYSEKPVNDDDDDKFFLFHLRSFPSSLFAFLPISN
jgi:hypothetical protein